eukprot:TRINITY_DN51317_c0_g1_i1.p1 TRINITY_DN51317_c0_g1~~TRINITY_DN51317_c0_g1_i1.p1  ORF type:complete len:429 (-),score=87.80 TRINITY_DN51317_c0_g1_i1:94-1314(-)
MAFLAGLNQVKLKSVPEAEKRDRSSANVQLAGEDALADEAERWKYFFNTGCGSWYEDLKEHTFGSTFVDLRREEAEIIVNHWQQRQRAKVAAESEGRLETSAFKEELSSLLLKTLETLQPLQERLHVAVRTESEASSAGRAFVKLSTRSPKDSIGALDRAKAAYEERLQAAEANGNSLSSDDNERWKILSQEATKAGAVADGNAGLALFLDSERIFEDLEYALRAPEGSPAAFGSAGDTPGSLGCVNIVTRAWDPRLTIQSEFRGIVWRGKLTCLGQYFHPLYFPELHGIKDVVQADCLRLFDLPAVQSAVAKVGGNCIVDFAWLGPGEVVIVELNPFDGYCFGNFPASTGLFLWDNEKDQAVMKGEAPFELRVRESRLQAEAIKSQCHPSWRRIIYSESSGATTK